MMQMRARGFALRDAFPDVLKGLITAEEAQDYPDEAKPRQAKDITPRNPLDVIAPPEIPAITSEPATIHAAFEADQEADAVNALVAEATAADIEIVDIPEVAVAHETVSVAPEQHSEQVVTHGFALLLPGKDKPASVHASLDEWQDAYEGMAEKVAMSGKVLARDRMTKLRELKEANEDTIKQVDMVKRIRHTANYQKRLKALGAAQ